MENLRLVFFSDTHGKQNKELKKQIEDLSPDIVIFTGDMVEDRYSEESYKRFFEFFSEVKGHKIVISGNHDYLFYTKDWGKDKVSKYGIYYLENESLKIEGVNFYGTPHVVKRVNVKYGTQAVFYLERSRIDDQTWNHIPLETEVLLTHGPAFGVGDMTIYKNPTGCIELLKKTFELPKLKVHAFGHIHEAYGEYSLKEMNKQHVSINSSIVNEKYQVTNKPILFEYAID